MAFWHRIYQVKLLKRCCSRQIHSASSLHYYYTPRTSVPNVLENRIWEFVRKPTDVCFNARFFAVPSTGKIANGPRLNGEITARYVRLVDDEGHKVVPFRDALEQARQLKLDLVEVQRDADPPVCKITDYHRDLYQRQLKDKERAKSKSETTIRKGDFKEVRFAAKTEQKDLKMKADTVIRLMERGYRVKCVALGTQKKGGRALVSKKPSDDEEDMAGSIQEDEDVEGLGALLSRLTTLIEDVTIIESGPRVERRQAYVIVRHVKFGLAKKGGAKKSKDAPNVTTGSGPIGSPAMYEDSESGINTEDEILSYENDPTPAHDYERVGMRSTALQEPSHAPENRYKRSEPRNQFSQTSSMDDRDPDRRGVNFSGPNFSNLRAADDFKGSEGLSSSPQSPPTVAENRYRRGEARNQFPPKSPNFSHSTPEIDPNRADELRSSSSEPSFRNERSYERSNANGQFSPQSPPTVAENRYRRGEARNQFPPKSPNFSRSTPEIDPNRADELRSSSSEPSFRNERSYERSNAKGQFSPMDNRSRDRRDTGTNFNAPSFSNVRPANDYNIPNRFPSSPQDPSLGTENRYKRSEGRSQFSPMDNRSRDRRDTGTNFNAPSFSNVRPANDYDIPNRFPSSPQDPSLGTENRYKRSEGRSQSHE